MENEDGVTFIKTYISTKYNQQYLGMPNKNNQIYLYTTKNFMTKWSFEYNDMS